MYAYKVLACILISDIYCHLTIGEDMKYQCTQTNPAIKLYSFHISLQKISFPFIIIELFGVYKHLSNAQNFCLLLLLLFDLKKSVAEASNTLLETYGETAPSHPNCQFYFQQLESGDPKKYEDNTLQELLDENPVQYLNSQLIITWNHLHAIRENV